MAKSPIKAPSHMKPPPGMPKGMPAKASKAKADLPLPPGAAGMPLVAPKKQPPITLADATGIQS